MLNLELKKFYALGNVLSVSKFRLVGRTMETNQVYTIIF